MSRLVRIIGLLLLTVFVSGCITDKVAVYKETKLNKKQMRKHHAVYKVEQWPGNDGPKEVRVYGKEGKTHFAYKAEEAIDIHFLLSKIPNSKTGLHLMALPPQKGSDDKAMFFVGRAEKQKTMLWVVFANQPVAKDKLPKKNLTAEQLKTFLAKHADEYAKENKPQIVLAREKKKKEKKDS